MISLISQGHVMEGIVYRPNNITALEEKNITLFLNYIKLPALFGGLGSTVFRKFANFYVALSGLANLSAIIAKKYEIPKFHTSGKKTQIGYEDNNFSTNDIQGYREGDYQFMKDVKLERAQTSLDFAFEELIAFNAQVLNEILGAFETYEKKNTSGLLKREFFPVFQLQKLKTLHAELQVQLEKVQYCYTDIGRIFNDFKDDFIIYCKIIAQMKLAMTFFVNQMSENPDVIQAVEEMEQNMSTSIHELAQMIPQCAMRWPMLLEAIWKRAYKEGRTDVEQEARKAHQLIGDVFAQMELVSADFQYQDAMREFAEEIEGCDNLTQYGVLVKKFPDVQFALGVHGANFKEFELLIFDKCVVALELEPKRVTKKPMMKIWQKTIELAEKKRTFRRTFLAKDFDVIINRKTDRGRDALLWVKKIKDKKPVEEESFVLKLPAEQATEVESELRKNHKMMLAKIQEGSEHVGHSYSKYKGTGDLDECGLRCGECQKLMQGLFFCGIKCDTCNGIFHTECFSANKAALRDEDGDDCLVDPVLNLIHKQFDLVWEDFFVPHADQVTAQSLLKNRSWGTFLVIKTEAGMTLIVKAIETGELTSYDINTVEIDGETLFFIRKGTSAKNVVDLLSHHRVSHHLYTPIQMKDDISFDIEDEMQHEVITGQDEPEADEVNPEAHSNYFWGEMTSNEASKKLADTPPGTFLLRRNRDQFKLSWKTYLPKSMHATIETVDGRFQLKTTNITFDTLHQLTSHFQIQTKNQKVALGSPLLKDPDLEDVGLQRQESFKIPSFQGTMSAKEAEEMLLGQPDGTYVVRKPMYVDNNPKATPYRISYKHKERVSHLKLEINGRSFLVKHSKLEGGQIIAPSLSRMVDKLKFKGLFESPLHGLRRSTIGSVREVSFCAEPQKPRSYTQPTVKYLVNNLNIMEALLEESLSKGSINEDPKIEEPTFLHNLNNLEAKGMLANKPVGAWILYYMPDCTERIAYKAVDDKVVHIKIFRVSSGFSLKQDDKEAVALEVLIARLESEGKLKHQITQLEDTDEEED